VVKKTGECRRGGVWGWGLVFLIREKKKARPTGPCLKRKTHRKRRTREDCGKNRYFGISVRGTGFTPSESPSVRSGNPGVGRNKGKGGLVHHR